LSPEEQAEETERQRVLAERAEVRAREVAAIEALVPSLALEGEPKTQAERLIPIDARTGTGNVLAIVPRPNGSELHVTRKDYDGLGDDGGPPRTYVHLSVWFRSSGAHRMRSRGCAIEGPAELRALRDACDRVLSELGESNEPEVAGGTAGARCDEAAPTVCSLGTGQARAGCAAVREGS
jgi:hypothetical protein